MIISSVIGGLTVLYFATILVMIIVDRFTFKRKLKRLIETGKIKLLPEDKQIELESKV